MARRSQRRAWCCGSRSEWEAVALSKRCQVGIAIQAPHRQPFSARTNYSTLPISRTAAVICVASASQAIRTAVYVRTAGRASRKRCDKTRPTPAYRTAMPWSSSVVGEAGALLITLTRPASTYAAEGAQTTRIMHT
jgi:hypothetical protein